MGSDWIMDPILHLVERSSGIIDLTLGSTDMSGDDTWCLAGRMVPHLYRSLNTQIQIHKYTYTNTDRVILPAGVSIVIGFPFT